MHILGYHIKKTGWKHKDVHKNVRAQIRRIFFYIIRRHAHMETLYSIDWTNHIVQHLKYPFLIQIFCTDVPKRDDF